MSKTRKIKIGDRAIFKGILIDANSKSFVEVDVDAIRSDMGWCCYDGISKILGCSSVESTEMQERLIDEGRRNLLYVDSCGLLKENDCYIKTKWHEGILPPKAIVIGYAGDLGFDDELHLDHTTDIKSLETNIMFLSRNEAKALMNMIDSTFLHRFLLV